MHCSKFLSSSMYSCGYGCPLPLFVLSAIETMTVNYSSVVKLIDALYGKELCDSMNVSCLWILRSVSLPETQTYKNDVYMYN